LVVGAYYRAALTSDTLGKSVDQKLMCGKERTFKRGEGGEGRRQGGRNVRSRRGTHQGTCTAC